MEIPKGYFVRRCRHIKTNGTQCGSPALRDEPHCFFHQRWHQTHDDLQNGRFAPGGAIADLPLLEDADSIQLGIMQVTQLLIRGRLDPKIAGLLLYAMQTASNNLRKMTLEPPEPQQVVIDPEAAENACIGDHAWQLDEFPESKAQVPEKQSGRTESAGRRAPVRRPSAGGDQSLLGILLERLGLPNTEADGLPPPSDLPSSSRTDIRSG